MYRISKSFHIDNGEIYAVLEVIEADYNFPKEIIKGYRQDKNPKRRFETQRFDELRSLKSIIGDILEYTEDYINELRTKKSTKFGKIPRNEIINI